MSLRFWPVIIARGPHPFPSRTRSLSLAARMVLPGRPGGRVRRRRPILQNAPIAPNSASGAFLHPRLRSPGNGNGGVRFSWAWARAGACGRRTHTCRCTGTGSQRSSPPSSFPVSSGAGTRPGGTRQGQSGPVIPASAERPSPGSSRTPEESRGRSAACASARKRDLIKATGLLGLGFPPWWWVLGKALNSGDQSCTTAESMRISSTCASWC